MPSYMVVGPGGKTIIDSREMHALPVSSYILPEEGRLSIQDHRHRPPVFEPFHWNLGGGAYVDVECFVDGRSVNTAVITVVHGSPKEAAFWYRQALKKLGYDVVDQPTVDNLQSFFHSIPTRWQRLTLLLRMVLG